MKILLSLFLGAFIAATPLNAMQIENNNMEDNGTSYILIVGNNGAKGGIHLSLATQLHEKKAKTLTFQHPEEMNGHKLITIDPMPSREKNHIQKDFLKCTFPQDFNPFSDPKTSSVGRIYFEMIPPSIFPELTMKAQSILKSNQRFDASFFPSLVILEGSDLHYYNEENPSAYVLSVDYINYLFSFVTQENIETVIKKRENCAKEKNRIWPLTQLKRNKCSDDILAQEFARNFFKALLFYIDQTNAPHDKLSKIIMNDISILKTAWVKCNKNLTLFACVFKQDSLLNTLVHWSHVFFIKETAFFLFEDFMKNNNFKDYSISFRDDPYTGRKLMPFITAYKK